MLSIEEFYTRYGAQLKLELIAGKTGLKRTFRIADVHRPGLSLTGYTKHFVGKRLLVFGNVETQYLKDVPRKERAARLAPILTAQLPGVVVAGKFEPVEELIAACDERRIPLFRCRAKTSPLMSQMTQILDSHFAPTMSCHGTLVEAFGVGALIQGSSSVGKSEAALGLIERGHRLITDDIVRMQLCDGKYIEGSGPELTRHMMEIRGIGIINVAHLYGAVCVRDSKAIDLAIKLEEWDDKRFYDRIGLDEKFCELLGIQVPFHVLPVKPGRDVVLLIETIILNHRLKEMGYHSAKEFNAKLLEAIAQKQRLHALHTL